jgi:hypothetical protein
MKYFTLEKGFHREKSSESTAEGYNTQKLFCYVARCGRLLPRKNMNCLIISNPFLGDDTMLRGAGTLTFGIICSSLQHKVTIECSGITDLCKFNMFLNRDRFSPCPRH